MAIVNHVSKARVSPGKCGKCQKEIAKVQTLIEAVRLVAARCREIADAAEGS